jgi:hypothetical protein
MLNTVYNFRIDWSHVLTYGLGTGHVVPINYEETSDISLGLSYGLILGLGDWIRYGISSLSMGLLLAKDTKMIQLTERW